MMQKTFTIFVFSLIFYTGLFAQDPVCVPGFITQDTAFILPLPFNFTDMTGGLDSTCVGLFYEEVFTTLVPPQFAFNGGAFDIDSISLNLEGAFTGLPPGLDYACNPPNCGFAPDSAFCFVITGMVDPDAEPMTYILELAVNVFFTGIPDSVEFILPDYIGDGNLSYFIDVASEADCDMTVSTSELQRELSSSISPNPTSDFVELTVEAISAKDVQLLITDMMGKVYQEKNVRLEVGQNTIPYYLEDLGRGIYFLNITDGKDFLSHKLVVER